MQRFRPLSKNRGWPRVVSIQNPYNLLNRSFEVGLAEIAIRDQVGLLAHAPPAFGLLSGNYKNGARPEPARLALFEHFQRYNSPQARRFASAYIALTCEHGIDPAQLALAYMTSRPFVTRNIIGTITSACSSSLTRCWLALSVSMPRTAQPCALSDGT